MTVGDRDAAWLVFVVYFAVDLLLGVCVCGRRVLYVSQIFKEAPQS